MGGTGKEKGGMETAEKPAADAGGFDLSAMSDKQLAMLEAAQRVFLDCGFAAAGTDAIQRAAGVSKATLYAHFGNKEGMFSAMIRWNCARYFDRAKGRLTAGTCLRERLRNLARGYLELLMRPEAAALFRIVLEAAPRFPQLAALFYESAPGRVNALTREILERAVAEGELRLAADELDAAAQLFAAMARGEPFLRRALYPKETMSAEARNAWADMAVERFLAAYGAAAGE